MRIDFLFCFLLAEKMMGWACAWILSVRCDVDFRSAGAARIFYGRGQTDNILSIIFHVEILENHRISSFLDVVEIPSIPPSRDTLSVESSSNTTLVI